MTKTLKGTWIHTPLFDLLFILSPGIVTALFCLMNADIVNRWEDGIQAWHWFLLVVLVDVAHVYTTLWRSYFDPKERSKYPTLLWMIPLFCFLSGVALYGLGSEAFWRVLAYLALFHFVRQQYGFFRLYERSEPAATSFERFVSHGTLYASMFIPVLYWHTEPRKFHWFVDGDFLQINAALGKLLLGAYLVFCLAYVFLEVRRSFHRRSFNLPKNLLLIATALSWWTGIVIFNSDFAFTLTNVLTHGIPYMALVWLYDRRQSGTPMRWIARVPRLGYQARLFAGIFLFLALPIGLAVFEEAIWDTVLWREHGVYFDFFYFLPKVESETVLMWLVPLLALPQSTHYVLDGFIWRLRGQASAARQDVLSGSNAR